MAAGLNQIWKLIRNPASIANAMGASESNPQGFEISKIIQPTIDLNGHIPFGKMPTRSVRAIAPSVAGERSIIELVPGAGDLVLTCLFYNVAMIVAWAVSDVQRIVGATTTIVTGITVGDSQALLQVGSAVADVLPGCPFALGSAAQAQNMAAFFGPIPQGRRLVFQGGNAATQLDLLMIFHERNGGTLRAEGG